MKELLIQAIGFIGVALFILSYQFRSNKKLLLCQITGSSMFIIQFAVMGAYGGCLNLIIALIRNLLIMNRDRISIARGWTLCWMLLSASLTVTVYTWEGALSLLPFFAIIGSTIGYWTDNPQKLRLSNLACASPCWLVYDIIIGSWGGVVNELVTTISALVSIYRFGWKALGNTQAQARA